MSQPSASKDKWNTKLGVILAVAGSAIGFGNFLRFPGLAAQFGGGAFMIAYFCSFLLLGIPMAWMEWSIGRHGGRFNGHSITSAYAAITKNPIWPYLAVFSLLTPMGLIMYYLFVEGWTLAYAYHMLMGNLDLQSPQAFKDFFIQFTGQGANGDVLGMVTSSAIVFSLIALVVNLILIYRGVSKGIEVFCRWSMPILLGLSLLILVRVLTLGTPDAAMPERNVESGLGFMWNPDKWVLLVEEKTVEMVPANYNEEQREELIARVQAAHPEQKIEVAHQTFTQGLLNPELWLAAAGQIFFSLSIGTCSIITYASYVSRKEDIALSSFAANMANELIEVGISGLMTVPAAVAFLGVSSAVGMTTFGLGFEVLPQVFEAMPAGRVFGVIFFSLLFLAAATSSISQIFPATSFLEDYWKLSRKQSITIITFFILGGNALVHWFTADGLLALNTLDFFFGTLGIYLTCVFMYILFTCVWGVEAGFKELDAGAKLRIPRVMMFVMRWITPVFLFSVFAAWLYQNLFVVRSQHIQNLIEMKPGALYPMLWMGLLFIFFVCVVRFSKRREPED